MVFRAMLLDAYRQLSAAKLFWLIMGLSLVVVTLYASVGFDDTGIFLFFGLTHIESELLVAGSPWARGLYVGIYSSFLVPIWLAWIATILALISTCTIFPEFVHSGAIELTLAKPIGRLRLFLMKYGVSLLFVILQVLVFCIGIFFCVGLRMGEWNWTIFAAVPIVAIFFSYLFAVCSLVGMVTRSGITALLVTVVFWMGLWSAQTAEMVLNSEITKQQVTLDRFAEDIEKEEAKLAAIMEKSENDERIEGRKEHIESMKGDIGAARILMGKIDTWYIPVTWGLAVLPKTGQTIGLLDRWMSDQGGFNLAAIMRGEMELEEEMQEINPTSHRARNMETMSRLEDEYNSKSLWYVLGTSLLFEGFVLVICGWYFCRKDF